MTFRKDADIDGSEKRCAEWQRFRQPPKPPTSEALFGR